MTVKRVALKSVSPSKDPPVPSCYSNSEKLHKVNKVQVFET